MATKLERFGKYILLEKIQTGGMAEIYLARRPGANGVSKFIAIKRILPQFSEQQEFKDMFKEEAKIAVNLQHSNIVSIHEFGEENAQLYIAMDYVEGRNLRQFLSKLNKNEKILTTEQIIYIVKEVALGLDHAHRCIDTHTGKPLNIIHRDMSPQNIMINFEGEVKIVDFGIAKAESQADMTRAGTLKGKFGYMSPEQAEGLAVDQKTDIFALGIILWELLAGVRLFEGKNELNILRKVKECQIPSLRKIKPNIPIELENIVGKALAKDKNFRHQSAAAFHRELSRFLNRHFPDFSPQDFAHFIRSNFDSEILENRQKMIEFAKIDIPEPERGAEDSFAAASEFNDSDRSFNQSVTKTEPRPSPAVAPPRPARAAPPPPPQPQGQAAPVKPPPSRPENPEADEQMEINVAKARQPGKVAMEISAKNVRTDSLRVDRTGLRDSESSYYQGHGTYTSGVRSQSLISVRATAWSPSNVIVPLFMMVIVGFFAFLYVNPPKGVPEPVDRFIAVLHRFPGPWKTEKGETTQTSEMPKPTPLAQAPKFKVNLSTIPSGAEIFVNDAAIGDTTPTVVELDRNSKVKLRFRVLGYIPYEQEIAVTSNMAVEIRLVKERMGNIDVFVRGAGEIYVNGKKVASASPLISHPVPADTDIVVRAYDPRTQASAEQRIRVGENQSQKITLIPGLGAAGSTSGPESFQNQ